VEELPGGRPILIYGSGSAGKALLLALRLRRPDLAVAGFLDSFRPGRCCGLPVSRLADLVDGGDAASHLILIASMQYREISAALEAKGISDYRRMRIPPPFLAELAAARHWRARLAALARVLLRLPVRLLRRFLSPRFLCVGAYGGQFNGNGKYFFLHLRAIHGRNVFWLCRDPSIRQELRRQGVNVLPARGWRFRWTALTSRFLVVDNRDWPTTHPFLTLLPFVKLQLWHGVGFKRIEKALLDPELVSRMASWQRDWVDRRYPRYDLLASTSEFYAREVFAPAFDLSPARIVSCGYPLDDLFYRSEQDEDLIFTDGAVLERVRQHRAGGGQVIVYAPTFRDLDAGVRFDEAFDLPSFHSFLEEHGLLLVVKAHSLPGLRRQGAPPFSSIVVHDPIRDVYPILKRADLLVTDYSSIYSDFLHTGRPIVFFPYDFDDYAQLHRQLQFDYDAWTPGPKAKNQSELERWIAAFLVRGEDDFAEERNRFFALAFAHHDGQSAPRLYRHLGSCYHIGQRRSH